MGFPVEYWSRCNEKFSSIIKSTRLSLLLTTLIFLSVSSASAEPRRCYWCGPLAEQVHRSRRARPCAAPLQETVCDDPHYYCATIALGPPYTESRLCVKKYQDECYTLYCNTTRTYKMTCPCRGDFCNGPNTPREEAAFKQLRQLAASNRTKRFIRGSINTTAAPTLPPMNRIDDHSASDQTGLVTNYTDYHFGNATRDETRISALNNSEKSDDSEVTGVNTGKTHETIINESDINNEVEKNQPEAKKETKRSEIKTNATVDTTTATDHEMSVDKKLTVTSMNMSIIVNGTIANQHGNVTAEDNKVNELNNTSSQEIYRSITTEQSTAYSTEINVNGTSEKPSDSDNFHLRNEIPIEHEVPITEIPAPVNLMNETIHDVKENNKEQRLNTSEASLNEITITKQDTNTNSSHSIVILDKQLESTADGMDTNFDETCNKTQTCNVNESSTAYAEESKKTDKETQSEVRETLVTLPEIKEVTTENPYMNTAATEAKASNESKNSSDTQKPAIGATTNQAEPLESTTSVFTTLPSKLVTSTEANSTLGIKKSKQISKKNNAFTISGSTLLLAHTFLVMVAL